MTLDSKKAVHFHCHVGPSLRSTVSSSAAVQQSARLAHLYLHNHHIVNGIDVPYVYYKIL